MESFFEKRVTKVARKSLFFLIVTFSLLITLMLVQVVFLGLLEGDHRYTWILVPANGISNTILWVISSFILAINLGTSIWILITLIRKIRNPFILKSNLYILLWVPSVFILNILVPNLIPVNYMFPVIAIVVGSTSIVLL